MSWELPPASRGQSRGAAGVGLARGQGIAWLGFLETPKPHKKGPTSHSSLKAPVKYGVQVGRHRLGGLERDPHTDSAGGPGTVQGTEKVLNE